MPLDMYSPPNTSHIGTFTDDVYAGTLAIAQFSNGDMTVARCTSSCSSLSGFITVQPYNDDTYGSSSSACPRLAMEAAASEALEMLPLIRLRNIDRTGKPQAASVPAVETRKPKPSDLTFPIPEFCLGDSPVQITNWTLANSNFEPDTLDGWNLLQEERILDIANFQPIF
jgi:hypothetical protein